MKHHLDHFQSSNARSAGKLQKKAPSCADRAKGRYQLARFIQGDLSALMQAVSPGSATIGSESETVDSFWATTER
jgi:hypothetical protein